LIGSTAIQLEGSKPKNVSFMITFAIHGALAE